MRLLATVEGSVLWLLRSNEWAEDNLRREAEARGIDPARLIFAGTLPHHEHLGRLGHADLFLDTFNVNAHTTASDALWAGLPVLTKAGRQFAARVGASLVSAVGLPELVVTTEAEYEARALELATTPGLMAELRARLAANRLTHPLFDTVGYTRQLEAAYTAVYQRYAEGLAPDHIAID
jgi:predicted O-linked N-acetylglucosamine transferase (SPINDLY family)